ncbi:hypothetical protein GGS26DRAFT_593315 [Hypomontagnella submonticulosa]|nr:hypothetical protein GGS26DRAFT_593315 [Hypomontagnella submonticulosa]
MPHATKKPARPRRTTAVSAPTSFPVRTSQQPGQSSSTAATSPSSTHSYTWTAADAAKASKDGAFLTAWPRDESYYAPPVQFLDHQSQGYQGQYYYSSTYKPSTASNQGGSSSGSK